MSHCAILTRGNERGGGEYGETKNVQNPRFPSSLPRRSPHPLPAPRLGVGNIGISHLVIVRMCPGDPGRSRSGMDTRPGNGRCDNLVCTVGVYLNFIGELAVTWTWESGGGDAAGGFLFRFIGSGTRRRSSRFPEGTLPSDQYRSSSSVARAFSLPPVSTPSPFSSTLLPLYPSFSRHLSLYIFYSLSWGASNIFLSSRSRP